MSPERPNDPPCSFGRTDHARRRLLGAAVIAAADLMLPAAARGEDSPASEARPAPGDVFVFAEGDREGEPIAPDDIPAGGPQVQAWPMDPRSKLVRDGSRLNQVLLLRLDPATLDEETRPRAAGGIVAYSAICSHAGCPVTGWVDGEETQVLKCFCHNSEYDPRRGARVVFGPAPRHLAALPIKLVDGTLVVAGKFIGKVVPQQS
jgi:Rieske Fe-S protein